MSIPVLVRTLVGLTLFALAIAAQAEVLKPMVLAYSTAGGDVGTEAEAVRERLTAAGFEALGQYEVDGDVTVLVFTSGELLEAAAASDRGAYIAPLRVAVTRVNGELQVSYNNLEYFAHAYRVDRSLAGVMSRVESAIGAQETFGARGLGPESLARYRYAFGMERFDDPYDLATYPSTERALAALDANLRARKGGVREVYRVRIPGRDAILIGVAIREDAGAERDASDLFKMTTVDVGERRHSPYLPYEILIVDGRVEALHMRFRMALHFPDLRMMGENSFLQLRRSPAALEETLVEVAGG
ncbi:hypothetical protein [Thioalkalivibrio sp.]|uniref:hypothetical protein n=1 Tax=Thioalkalivibrio sp. TaxID=2093813 RepID=UPI003566AA2C